LDSRPKVVLLTVASGDAYVGYAERMLASAAKHFLSDGWADPTFLMLQGRTGWPAATMQRYHVIVDEADRFADASHVFHIDADMLFVAPVGREILGSLVGTTHPGYVGRRGTFEERPESAAYVAPGEGRIYYCGGFVGGERGQFLRLAEAIRDGVDEDARKGIVALWHDESHLNRYFVQHRPGLTLSPSYCYPANDSQYVRRIWSKRYEPRIVALNKPRLLQLGHRLARLRGKPK
jgi:histo-blood group ABO system transferase